MKGLPSKLHVLLYTAFLCHAHTTTAVAARSDPEGPDAAQIRAMIANSPARGGTVAPEDLPDIFGPGAVLTVGNILMKVTNWGWVGNLIPVLSSDPSGQWRGASGIEYLNGIRLGVAAVNVEATNPAARRRVSYLQEWRPRTLEPVDKIYRAYDGIVNGGRFFNDDDDGMLDPGSGLRVPLINEDFLDGRDNDGDGSIDEDFGAMGQQNFSFTMWDNTPEAVNFTFNEKHVPLGLECRQRTWAYSIEGFQDFNVIEYEIFNRSGHDLDSVCVGFGINMDAGPAELSGYFADDFDLPHYPSGAFELPVGALAGELPDVKRAQFGHDPILDHEVSPDSALCPRQSIRINAFSIADDNGDETRTAGLPSFILLDHSIDPLGLRGPKHVGFRAFRSYAAGTSHAQGGLPSTDQERFAFMTSTENLDLETGFVNRAFAGGETKADYIQWAAVGSPWKGPSPDAAPPQSGGLWRLSNGQSITVTVAFAVAEGTIAKGRRYLADYERYRSGAITGDDLLAAYPSLANLLSAQIAFEGVHETREGYATPDFHGRETGMRRPVGAPDTLVTEDCPGRDLRTVQVNGREYSWFDFDCDYCTGVYDYNGGDGRGLFHKTWNAAASPPGPNTNLSTSYNFTDNPDRRVVPSGDHTITLAWDNLSETTPDPKSECFDFRGYRVWKVSDWSRPVGSAGPADADWELAAELRLFDYEDHGVPIERNYTIVNGERVCPRLYIPSAYNPRTGTYGDSLPICLDRGDLWDRQSGNVIRPDTSFRCLPDPADSSQCRTKLGGVVHRGVDYCKLAANKVRRPLYPIGRYQFVDDEVKNGFVYFYSVSAFDSTFENSVSTELGGRRSAVESEGVAPQAGTRAGRQVWVVPNPYRGYAAITRRSSAWDMTPSAADPTGSHIDFFGLPQGAWTIRIFTVSGDWVAQLRSTDPVNESLRAPQIVPAAAGTATVPGYNRQQDYAGDGQARWNLISRNGQDIASGVYLFTVESSEGTQRGKFVVIR